VLPGGDDPDTFIRNRSGRQYAAQLQQSTPYLDYLLDRTAAAHDLRRDDSRRAFLQEMLAVAARVPDAAGRDQFADRIAHRARITESVVRDEIRKAAVERRTEVGVREMPSLGQFKPAERGIIWALMNQPDDADDALVELDASDLDGLASGSILAQALRLRESGAAGSPAAFLARLSQEEAELVTGIASAPAPPASPHECALALKRLRFEREGAAVQQEIDRLQQAGCGGDIDRLWQQKHELLQRIATLGNSGT
jgi:DNA primase